MNCEHPEGYKGYHELWASGGVARRAITNCEHAEGLRAGLSWTVNIQRPTKIWVIMNCDPEAYKIVWAIMNCDPEAYTNIMGYHELWASNGLQDGLSWTVSIQGGATRWVVMNCEHPEGYNRGIVNCEHPMGYKMGYHRHGNRKNIKSENKRWGSGGHRTGPS